jgi:hypothetical protein
MIGEDEDGVANRPVGAVQAILAASRNKAYHSEEKNRYVPCNQAT